ncbi:MAG: FAD-dependent oxidoreductase [Oscillospiraceae bacterium]|nr:FAD-dependent oxidoreductase [Oscillospiraceae bacterium]
MSKIRKILLLTACCLAVCLLIGGAAYLDAARGRTYGYKSYIAVSALRRDDGSFYLNVDSENETPAIGDQAVENTIARINEGQTLDVDVLTGATVSSAAALESARLALSRLGYDTESLAERPSETYEESRRVNCDVVIIGAGGAGLTAAIEAAEAGAEVVVVEKLGIAGGSTARSEGKIMASGSALQLYYGIKDTTASFAGYLYEFVSENIQQSRLIALAENSGANIDFLKLHGVSFSNTLLASGDEAQRIHLAVDSGEASGGALVTPLREAAEELGVEFYYGAAVNEIMTDVYSNIKGVRAQCLDGSELTVYAPATVIASGGYDRSPSLTAKYTLGGSVPAYSYSGLGSTGEVTQLAADLGAHIIKGALIAELRDFSAGTESVHGLLVNEEGERFVNEASDSFELGSALQASGDSKAWLILDSALASAQVKNLAEEGQIVSASSLEQLASALGAPQLETTVSRYNYICQNRADEDYGKRSRYLESIGSGPYYAVPYELASYGTLGGIRTNISCQAMSNIAVVPGLYACGEAAFGSYMDESYPGFGSSLAIVIETGRVAGKNAAAYALSVGNG